MTTKNMTAEALVDSLKETFKGTIKDVRIEHFSYGLKKNEIAQVWVTIPREQYKELVKHLITIEKYPHFAVSSGYQIDDTIYIVNHFCLFYGNNGKEVTLNVTVPLPKSDPTIDTITDLIPGALIAEQEKQEMLGIKVKNIPKDRRVFISKDFPEGMYPWRRDKSGAEKMARNLHEVKK
ncbi:MAG: NADH-quinone oxidoreductase subunit C [Candidatus Thermoplasmatota archaeon]|nr:NADH-quinone oxidoreductase subunit C [Candidatus Thermoplasmatota archaeon]MBU1941016.1 NADH-quinone oxidoreductase subunit C [Candidatus Thermoplasmatota archaeon]